MVMASRDVLYLSRRSAGERGSGNEFHGDCDCQVIAVRDESDLPSGYDPEEMVALYESARDEAGTGNLNDIVHAARRQNPDKFTDGVHEH